MGDQIDVVEASSGSRGFRPEREWFRPERIRSNVSTASVVYLSS